MPETPPSPSRVSAEAHTAEAATFLEQDSTTVPNFAYRLILSCGNLVGVATLSPPFCGLRRLKNPRKNIFGFFKKHFRFAPCFSPIGERANHKKKGAESHEKIQHAPPPPGYVETNPARDIITKFGKQGKTPDPYTIEQMQQFMGSVIGTEWELPVVLAGMYGLRISEIIGLRTDNIDLEKMQFSIVEQLPFNLPAGTKMVAELAPTKSNDRTLPITEDTLPYFLRRFDQLNQQKNFIEASGGTYYDNHLFIAKPDGSPERRDRMSANFGQLIRHLELPHIRFHDLRHSAATNMHQLTGDFYTVGEILGHTLKGIGMSLGISTNLEAVTAQYVDVRLERKKAVLEAYHKALHPMKKAADTKKRTPGKPKKKSQETER